MSKKPEKPEVEVLTSLEWTPTYWEGAIGPYRAELGRLATGVFAWEVYLDGALVKQGKAGTPTGAKSIINAWVRKDARKRRTDLAKNQ